jgi:alpha-tubulin suppressor-like RCC1 family protein
MQQVQGILTDRQASHDNVPLRECTPEKRYKFFEGDEERKALFDSSDYVKQVTCGPFHTLVLTSKGRVFSSGLKLTGDLSSNDYSIEFSEFK